MKYHNKQNNVEVIVVPHTSYGEFTQKVLINWLTTTAQASIFHQHERITKRLVGVLTGAPPIYLS